MSMKYPIEELRDTIDDETKRLGLSSSGLFIHADRDAYQIRLRLPVFATVTIDHEVYEAKNIDEIKRLVREACAKLYEDAAAHILGHPIE